LPTDFFDEVITAGASPQTAKSFIDQALACYNKKAGYNICNSIVSPANLKDIVSGLESGLINAGTAKVLFTELLETPASGNAALSVPELIKSRGLAQMSDEEDLRVLVKGVLTANPKQVEDFRTGKTKVREFLAGQVMKQTKGKANPAILSKVLDQELAAGN
jgi:aspartyl-tRNA(Asn)/glutamyl-tRNA(Gln) amidotransferase subunit B